MDTALAVITALSAAVAAVGGVLAAIFAKRAADATELTARKTEWGLNFRAAVDRLESDSEEIKQLGTEQLREMFDDGSLDEDQKRQVYAVAKHLLREQAGEA